MNDITVLLADQLQTVRTFIIGDKSCSIEASHRQIRISSYSVTDCLIPRVWHDNLLLVIRSTFVRSASR